MGSILKAVSCKSGNLKNLENYLKQEEKTEEKLMYGKDCNISYFTEQFNNTKIMHEKEEGRQYKHSVHSYNPDDKIDHIIAHEQAKKIANEFKNHEVAVITHKDKENIHSHIVVNSVNYKTGKKIHMSNEDLQNLKDNMVKRDLKIGILEQEKSQEQGKILCQSTKKYRAIEKHFKNENKSYLVELAIDIKNIQEQSQNRANFVAKMKENNWEVNWKDTHKNVTFINTETKKRVRLSNLVKTFNDNTFSKEGLTHEFERFKEQQQTKNRDIRERIAEEKRIAAEKQIAKEMVFVKGGTFQMGSNEGYSNEKPIHSVTVADFYIGKYQVTQKLWQGIMGNNPSHFKGDKRPVENVSWDDTQAFLRKLNAKTGKKYRLLTEAEWEYAARGGASTSSATKYAGSNNIGEVAWYDGNSGSKTHEVGTKAPNQLGIYDMSGNVWEWCSDWYGADYYKNSPQNNPQGAKTGSYRVLRGGSWILSAKRCRSANRGGHAPTNSNGYYGFRLVRAF